jgi:Flp pilus assembly pilin Flp
VAFENGFLRPCQTAGYGQFRVVMAKTFGHDVCSSSVYDREDSSMVNMGYRLQFLWTDRKGQDLLEYALIVGLVAVVVAGFLPPALMPSISTIFSKVISGFNAS